MMSNDITEILAQFASAWRAVAGLEPRRIVLCGAGRIGALALEWCQAHGIEPRWFADNDRARWVESGCVPVDYAVQMHPDDVFVVTIQRANDVAQQLRGYGAKRVCGYQVLYHSLADCEGAECLGELWADQASVDECIAQLRYRLDSQVNPLPPHEPPESIYFAPEYTREETVIDCGAYTGDTLLMWLERVGGFRRWVAFEPDPKNFANLCRTVATLDDIDGASVSLYSHAVGSKTCTRQFAALADMNSRLTADGPTAVECVRLDDTALWGDKATVIKMDIEGGEMDALRGAEQTIRRNRPILAISVYHRPDDLWRIPIWIHGLQLGYSLFLRRYGPQDSETVIYGLPIGRRC